jgi:nucleoside-diphosphate-sugar epimerase
MKAIITGAGGFIGSTLVKKLIENGISVLAIDVQFNTDFMVNSNEITRLCMSVEDIALIKTKVSPEEYDLFYHLAWQGVNGPSKGAIDIQVHNIELAVKCAMVAKDIGCRKFLCSGSIAEKSTQSLPLLKMTSAGMFYGVAKDCTHRILETYCKNIGLNLIWMQFSNIYGPLNKTGNLISYAISEILHNRPAFFGPAQQPYDFIYVDDLIEAVYRLGVKHTHHNFYFIGSGSPKILREYLSSLGDICKRPDLIRFGVREDDGIKYEYSMFDNSLLVQDIGNYIGFNFEKGIENTVVGLLDFSQEDLNDSKV